MGNAPWGYYTGIDLKYCNPETIRDAEKIKQYIIELCALIDMKRFGDSTVVRFGDDPKVSGYSMVQLIETSLVSGHFAEQTNCAYIDIFSCKEYDVEKAVKFTVTFFGAKNEIHRHILRY